MGETLNDDTLYWARKIGAVIRTRRRCLGLSLEELSRLSGATVPTLSHVERGNRDVKLSTLVSLASALRVDLETLLGETGNLDAVSEQEAIGYDLDDD